jgi:hypothetical protein
MDTGFELATKTLSRLGIKPADRLLVVHLGTQTMQFFRRGKPVRSFVISTSRRPPSCVQDSLGTPLGLHEIAERIGAGQPPGMVFKGRVPTGRHFREMPGTEQETNLITTRILRLRGLEPGANQGEGVDSFARYIYIHGTNHEDRLGTPVSGGCVLMHNTEIAALYEEVRAGDQVWIGE